jgi:hypothetical protein
MTILASATFTRSVASEMGEAALQLAEAGAAAGTGPNGRPWKPTISGNRALAGIGSRIRLQRFSSGFAIEVGPKMRGSVNVLAVDQFGSKGRFSKDGSRLRARQVRAAKRTATREGTSLDALGVRRTGPRIPARPVLPRRSLPRRWAGALERASLRVFARVMH